MTNEILLDLLAVVAFLCAIGSVAAVLINSRG